MGKTKMSKPDRAEDSNRFHVYLCDSERQLILRRAKERGMGVSKMVAVLLNQGIVAKLPCLQPLESK